MSNKKWLLFIMPMAYPCDIGGAEVFNHYLMDELKKYYSTHILSNCSKINLSGVSVHKLRKLWFKKITSPMLIFLFVLRKRKSIKLIYLSYSRAYWTHWYVYVILKRVFGVEYGLTIHGGGLSQWKPIWPYKSFFNNAKFITGVSDRILNEYTKRSERDIVYTPPLIPFNIIQQKNMFRDKWNLNKDDTIILYIGSLKPLKSVDTLIEALGLIPKEERKKHNIKVLIAGDGISKNDLEKRSEQLYLSDTIRFLGLVDRDTVSELYNIADIYTICSEFEGLPISLLEAFANGLPSITSDAPGLINLSLNNRNSLLFETKNFNEYASKIRLLLNDEELRKEVQRNAQEYYEKQFSYNMLIDDFKKLIDKEN